MIKTTAAGDGQISAFRCYEAAGGQARVFQGRRERVLSRGPAAVGPVLYILRKAERSWRPCGDYTVHALLKPPPRIHTLYAWPGCKVFSKLLPDCGEAGGHSYDGHNHAFWPLGIQEDALQTQERRPVFPKTRGQGGVQPGLWTSSTSTWPTSW